MDAEEKFDIGDYIVILAYFLFIVFVGFYSNILFKHRFRSFFSTWFSIGSSLFITNIGAEHFIGLAGAGAHSGLAVGSFELNTLIILQLSSWLFLPVFISSKVSTLPAYMAKRFGRNRIRIYLSTLSVFLYIFTKVSVNLFAGAYFLQQTLLLDFYISISAVLGITFICNLTGSLNPMMHTFQTLIMIAGTGSLAFIALKEVGGFRQLFDKYLLAVPNKESLNIDLISKLNETSKNFTTLFKNQDYKNSSSCLIPTENDFRLLRSLDDKQTPWIGFALGQTSASIWYWCTDQIVVRRKLSSKTLSHAQASTIFASLLKILPIFLIVFPGMISRILYTDEIACFEPEVCESFCQNSVSCFNSAYPRLLLGLMPSPFKGFVLVSVLGAIMFDLTSIFKASTELFVCDIWPRIRSDASSREKIFVRRILVFVMILISVSWVPIVEKMDSGQLYFYILDITCTFAPPIAAVYILAISVQRITEKGAFVSLIIGLFIGLGRMALVLWLPEVGCLEEDSRHWIVKLHFMYVAMVLFVVTTVICLAVSLIDNQVPEDLLIRTTYRTRFSEDPRVDETLNELQFKGNRYSDPYWTETTQRRASFSIQCFQRILSPLFCFDHFKVWFLMKESQNDLIQETISQTSDDLAQIETLKQAKCTQALLFLLTLFIVIFSIGIFIFFSMDWWNIVFY